MTVLALSRRWEVPWWSRVSAVAGPAALGSAWLLSVVSGSAHDSSSGRLTGGSPAPWWWVTPVAVMVAGVADVVTAGGLRPAAATGRWLLAVGGLILVVAAVLSVLNRTGFLYQDLGNVALVTLCVWPAAITPDRRSPTLGLQRRWGEALAAGLGALLVLYVLARTGSASTSSSYGPLQRLLLLAQSLAPLIVIVGLRVRRVRRRAPGPTVDHRPSPADARRPPIHAGHSAADAGAAEKDG